jgi:hypothetical protein
VKDSSQVAATISLKALHIQYDQAVAKAKNEKTQADATAAKQLKEAEAEQEEREAAKAAAKAAMPTQVLGMLRGEWQGHNKPPDMQHGGVQYRLQIRDSFDSIRLEREYIWAGFNLHTSIYVYKVAVNLDPQNSKKLIGKATCETLTGPKYKKVLCEPDKSVPVTFDIEDQNTLVMAWENAHITIRGGHHLQQ